MIVVDQIVAQPIKNFDGTGDGRSRLKIVLADDNHALLRELKRVLDIEFEIVSTVANGRALLEEYDRLHPEVIVMDISMPFMDGFEALANLRRRGTPKVVVFTVHEEQAFVEEAKALGAVGYVLKRSRATVLVDAIRSAHEGCFFLCPELCK